MSSARVGPLLVVAALVAGLVACRSGAGAGEVPSVQTAELPGERGGPAADAEAPRACRVQVQDLDGRPVAAALVIVHPYVDWDARAASSGQGSIRPPWDAPVVLAQQVTDANGIAVVEAPDEGGYCIEVEAPGFVRTVRDSPSVLGPRLHVTLRPGYQLRGQVLDDEEPATGLPLVLVAPDEARAPSRAARMLRTVTDDAGAFSIDGLDQGTYSVWALEPTSGFTILARVRVPAVDAATFLLPRGGVVRGRVIDMSGAPISDVEVSFGIREVLGVKALLRCRTREDGSFSAVSRRYSTPVEAAQVEVPGQAPQRREGVGWRGRKLLPGEVIECEFRVPRGGRLAEVVRGPDDRAGPRASRDVSGGSVGRTTVRWPAPSRMSGRLATGTVVLPDGSPAAGARVHVGQRTFVDVRHQGRRPDEPTWDEIQGAVCDAEGRFRIPLPDEVSGTVALGGGGFAGTQDVGAEAVLLAELPGHACAVSGTFSVVEDEPMDVELRLTEGHTLSGVVRDVDGRPIEGAFVGLGTGPPYRDEDATLWPPVSPPNWAGAIVATTDADGRFEVRGLGARSVRAWATSPGCWSDGRRVDLPATEPIELTLQPRLAIAGRLDAPDGYPVTEARVRVIRGDSTTERYLRPDGTFRATPLLPGTYRVQIVPPLGLVGRTVPERPSVEAGTDDLRFEWVPAD